jgi:hypothetical protein
MFFFVEKLEWKNVVCTHCNPKEGGDLYANDLNPKICITENECNALVTAIRPKISVGQKVQTFGKRCTLCAMGCMECDADDGTYC